MIWLSYTKTNTWSKFKKKSNTKLYDGNPYTWDELGKGLHNLDGFQIRIETADPAVDFERELRGDDDNE